MAYFLYFFSQNHKISLQGATLFAYFSRPGEVIAKDLIESNALYSRGQGPRVMQNKVWSPPLDTFKPINIMLRCSTPEGLPTQHTSRADLTSSILVLLKLKMKRDGCLIFWILVKTVKKSNLWSVWKNSSNSQILDMQSVSVKNTKSRMLSQFFLDGIVFIVLNKIHYRRPAEGQKSPQKIVLMTFFSTSKQLCQIFSTKITNDDVRCWQI